jgi:hypothetical protein
MKFLVIFLALAVWGCAGNRGFEHESFVMGWTAGNVTVTPYEVAHSPDYSEYSCELLGLWQEELNEQWREDQQKTVDYLVSQNVCEGV